MWSWRLVAVGAAQVVASSLWFAHLCTGGAERIRTDGATRLRAALAKDRPDAKPPLGVNDIAFGILTSDRYVDTRLHAQQLTWIRFVRHVVFYSERSVPSVPTVTVGPSSHEKLVGTGAWKDLPALKDMYKRFATLEWFFMVVRRAPIRPSVLL